MVSIICPGGRGVGIGLIDMPKSKGAMAMYVWIFIALSMIIFHTKTLILDFEETNFNSIPVALMVNH